MVDPTCRSDICGMALKRISELKANESGQIERVDCSDAIVALMELGCAVGETVELRHVAPLGDPLAVAMGGQVVAMRRKQACEVWVRVPEISW